MNNALLPDRFQEKSQSYECSPIQPPHLPQTENCLKLNFFNPFPPERNAEFSKSLTMTWKTTCDIPFKRYFLGCAINHTNRDGRGHILE